MTAARGAVIVTGASTGIGEACALHLDGLGFSVFAGVRKTSDGAALARKASDRLTAVSIDVADGASIASAAEDVATAVGKAGLAGLVNNAGIAVAGPLEFLPISELRKQLEVNVIGQIAVTQAFLPLLRQGHGRIVNIGSISGRMATPFVGPYAASKFAMEALTDSLRMELRPWSISVSLIEPGSVATPIWRKSGAAADELARSLAERAHDLYGPALAAMRKAADKIGRAGVPAAVVAKAVAHALVSKRPKTRYVVGRDAKFRAALVTILSDRMRDGLIAQSLGLPKEGGSRAPL